MFWCLSVDLGYFVFIFYTDWIIGYGKYIREIVFPCLLLKCVKVKDPFEVFFFGNEDPFEVWIWIYRVLSHGYWVANFLKFFVDT